MGEASRLPTPTSAARALSLRFPDTWNMAKLAFPTGEIRGRLLQVRLGYADGIAQVGLVGAQDRNGIASAPHFFNLVQAKAVPTILAYENATFLLIVPPA